MRKETSNWAWDGAGNACHVKRYTRGLSPNAMDECTQSAEAKVPTFQFREGLQAGSANAFPAYWPST